jgi:hypothetical protein
VATSCRLWACQRSPARKMDAFRVNGSRWSSQTIF